MAPIFDHLVGVPSNVISTFRQSAYPSGAAKPIVPAFRRRRKSEFP
jgi:hypothetical protein